MLRCLPASFLLSSSSCCCLCLFPLAFCSFRGQNINKLPCLSHLLTIPGLEHRFPLGLLLLPTGQVKHQKPSLISLVSSSVSSLKCFIPPSFSHPICTEPEDSLAISLLGFLHTARNLPCLPLDTVQTCKRSFSLGRQLGHIRVCHSNFDFQHVHKSPMWQCVPVIPVLGRQIQDGLGLAT